MTAPGPTQPSHVSRRPATREIDDQMVDVGRALPLVGRALRLRCPNCGGRSIFASWTRLRAQCPTCGLRLDRGESDYFIGAYLMNLVAVELLVALLLAIVVVATYPRTPWTALEWGAIALSLIGAIACYPVSQVVWLAADLWLRPLTPQEMEWHRSDGASRPDDLAQL
jgi:uncharacterized protein (DUF983 family)